MTQPSSQHDPIHRLVDAMVDDILETPTAELLAECAEDHGDPRALVAEFDTMVMSTARDSAAMQTRPEGPAPLMARPAAPRSSRAGSTGRLARLLGLWQSLTSPRGGRLGPWGLQIGVASLVVLAVASGVTVRWASHPATGAGEEFTRGLSPLPPSAQVRVAKEYIVQFAQEPSLDAALASYRNLQGKFQALLGERAPLIRKQVGPQGDEVYVAAVGPFAKGDEAQAICAELKRAGAACDVSPAAP